MNGKNLVSITKANQNFAKIARLVEETDAVGILKNYVPRYLVMEFSAATWNDNLIVLLVFP